MTTAPRILLLGDAHGDLGSIAKAVRWARDTQSCTAAIQVGDFGFYAEGMKAQLAELGRFVSVRPPPLSPLCRTCQGL